MGMLLRMKFAGLTFLLFAACASPGVAEAQDTFAAPPVITSPVQGATVIGSPVIAGIGAEAGATVQVNAQLFVCSGIAADDGSWSCQSSLGSGSQTVTAFQIDLAGNHSAPSEPVTFTVRLSPAISVGSNLNPSVAGQAVRFSASMGEHPPASGTIAFKDGQTPIAGCEAVPLGACVIFPPSKFCTSEALCTTSSLRVGIHSISAWYSGDATYLPSHSNTRSQVVNPLMPPPIPGPSTATDFNQDGHSDMVWLNDATGQVYRVFMDGLAIAGEGLAYTEPDIAWTIAGDADFNGDKVTDLLWRNENTGEVSILFFGPDGVPTNATLVWIEASAAWKIVGTPDLNGDGRGDILWWNASTGQVYAMLMDGARIALQGTVLTEPDTAWKIVAVGDFTGSGKKNQLVWRNSSNGYVWLTTVTAVTTGGGGFTHSGEMVYVEPNAAWKILAAPDFDGDGKSDLLWRNDATGMVYLMRMNGAAIVAERVVYIEPNLAWKIVAQGDYDGDARADLLWRNSSTGQVYMMLMNGGAIASQGFVYYEPNADWALLGPWEYSK